VPSFGTNVGGMAALAAISVVLSAVGIALFLGRDIGRTALLSRSSPRGGRPTPLPLLPVNAWSLRSVYARGLAMLAAPTIWWTIGVAAFAAFSVAIVKQTEQQLATIMAGSQFFTDLMTKVGGGDAGTSGMLLGALFILLPMLSMAFAVTQASRWASDDEEGRHELVLATPQPRLRVLLGRFGALATAAVFMGLVTLAVTILSASGSGVKLDAGNLVAATLSIIPQCLLMAAIGYLFAGWLRTALETGLLSFLLVIWFFISFIGPEIGFSGTVLKLSAFYYYGTPLAHGLPVGDMLIVIAVAAAALVVASVRFARKDIGRS
jgi:ABC-2 type transport system permease protein